jgi:hypothetical protein
MFYLAATGADWTQKSKKAAKEINTALLLLLLLLGAISLELVGVI